MSTPRSQSLASSSLLRIGAAVALTLSAACAGDAPPTPPPPVQSAGPAPAPAPVPPAAGGLHAGRNGDITIRIVTIDASGELSEDSHKILDDLLDQGWRSTGMTVVSATPPVTLAVMLTMPPKRPMQMRPGGPPFSPDNRPPQFQPGPPVSAGPPPVSATPPGPAPAPAPAPTGNK